MLSTIRCFAQLEYLLMARSRWLISSTVQRTNALRLGTALTSRTKLFSRLPYELPLSNSWLRKLSDATFVASIDSNQTPKLLTKFEKMFSGEVGAIETIQRVILMTPENIHLNSFMYEPILDMCDEHLRKLYRDVLALN